MSKRKFNFSKFFKHNWVVTLFSTMFGVIAGLYLTNHYEDKQLNNAKANALTMVKQELKKNKEDLFVYDSICRELFVKSSYVLSKIDTDNKIFIHRDSADFFKERSNGIMENLKFENHPKNIDSLRVRGDMNLFIGSKLSLLDLNDVIWQSYKQTNYINVTGFNCITNLEELYQFQEKNNKVNKDWLDEFMKGTFMQSEERLNEFMLQWTKALGMNESLLSSYESIEEIFKTCD